MKNLNAKNLALLGQFAIAVGGAIVAGAAFYKGLAGKGRK